MTRTPRRGAAAVAVAVVMLASLASIGRAEAVVATTIACGQDVTTDVVLQADVGPCPGAGFRVIGARNITIDLNRHRVVGPANLTPGAGVRIVNSDGVTLKGGTVTGFAHGVQLDNAPRSTLTDMDVSDNRGGISRALEGTSHAGGGIQVSFSPQSAVRRSLIAGNGPIAGIRVIESDDVIIESNVVRGNAVRTLTSSLRPDVAVQNTIGIYVTSAGGRVHGDRATIRDNQVLDNGRHGIWLNAFTRGNVVAGNQVHRNGLDQPVDDRILSYGNGVLVAALGNLIEHNVVTGNGKSGIEVGSPENVVRSNVAVFNSQRPNSFTAYDLVDRIFGCEGNVWSGNRYGTANQPCVTA